MKKIPSSGHLVSQSNRPISNKLFTDPAVAFLWLPLPSFDHIPSDTWLGPGRSFPNLTRAVLGGSLRRQQLGVSNVHDYALWKVKIVMWPWTLRLDRLIIAWLASWAKDEDNTLTRPSGGGRFQCKPLNIYNIHLHSLGNFCFFQRENSDVDDVDPNGRHGKKHLPHMRSLLMDEPWKESSGFGKSPNFWIDRPMGWALQGSPLCIKTQKLCSFSTSWWLRRPKIILIKLETSKRRFQASQPPGEDS